MRILKSVPEDFWWDVARQCDYATFFHTPLWRDVAMRAFPGTYHDETFGAILPNGVRVVFPLIAKRKLGPLRRLHSTVENCSGGFIADGPVPPSEVALLYKKSCQWSTYTFYVTENPLGPELPEAAKSHMDVIYKDNAYIVHLDADFDTIFSRFQRTQRKDYRRGLKNGVQFRSANSIDDYKAYYAIYRDAVDRWGKDDGYGYEWNLFELFYQMSLSHPENVKLWVLTINEQIVGGTVMFYWNQLASAWNGTAHRDFLDYDVMPVGDTEMIRDAITRGYRYFDFSTSGMKEGVMMYKERFGTFTKPVSIWLYQNPVLKPLQQWYWKRSTKES